MDHRIQADFQHGKTDAVDGMFAHRAGRRAFISRLGMTRDTHIINTHGPQVATEIRQRAASLEDDIDQIRELDRELVDRNINPGTTADLTVAATFVALERGMSI